MYANFPHTYEQMIQQNEPVYHPPQDMNPPPFQQNVECKPMGIIEVPEWIMKERQNRLMSRMSSIEEAVEMCRRHLHNLREETSTGRRGMEMGHDSVQQQIRALEQRCDREFRRIENNVMDNHESNRLFQSSILGKYESLRNAKEAMQEQLNTVRHDLEKVQQSVRGKSLSVHPGQGLPDFQGDPESPSPHGGRLATSPPPAPGPPLANKRTQEAGASRKSTPPHNKSQKPGDRAVCPHCKNSYAKSYVKKHIEQVCKKARD